MCVHACARVSLCTKEPVHESGAGALEAKLPWLSFFTPADTALAVVRELAPRVTAESEGSHQC